MVQCYITYDRREDAIATFGETIKHWRQDLRLGLREAARMLGISATYLSRLETDKETNPSEEVLHKIAKAYKKTEDEVFSVANRVPPEVEEVYTKNDVYKRKLPEFMRTVLKRDLSEEDWNQLIENANKRRGS